MEELSVFDVTSMFIGTVLYSINSEKEVPRINFIFNEESINFINYVKDKRKEKWASDFYHQI